MAAFDLVDAYVDEHWTTFEEDNWPAPAGTRHCQPSIGVSLEDVLEWSSTPPADMLAVHQGWFTLDIGRGRRLLPRAYCLRNGGSRFACPFSWMLHGAESRQGPWYALDARGFDWVNLTDSWEPLYKELAEGQKHVFPHDHKRGGWLEPEDGVVEPIPHHAAVWRVRNPDESGRGYRFFRLMQLRSRKYEVRRMAVQGFELYGALRMDTVEEEAEVLVNPPGLTEDEEGLLETQNEVGDKNKLSWDPRVLMERERQREYTGPTYADKMSEAYEVMEERFHKLTTEAVKAGKKVGKDKGGGRKEEQDGESGEDSMQEDIEPALIIERPRIELVNLEMMDAEELLRFVWGQQKTSHAIYDVKRWAALPDNKYNLPQVVDKWVQLTIEKGELEAQKTCELIDILVVDGLVDSKAVAAAVANRKLQDILRAENVVLLKHLNRLLSRLQLPLIPRASGGEGEDGHGEEWAEHGDGGEDDEMALLAELAARRGSGGGGSENGGEGGLGPDININEGDDLRNEGADEDREEEENLGKVGQSGGKDEDEDGEVEEPSSTDPSDSDS